MQETHYDPWGLELAGIGFLYEGIKSNKYLYQGKEMMDDHNLNIYDFHARGYDHAIGRTWQVDPGSESYHPMSPYSWVMNNPLKFIDPTGMFADYFDSQGYIGTDGKDDGEIRVTDRNRNSLPNNFYLEDGKTVNKEVGKNNSKLLHEIKFIDNKGALKNIVNHYLGKLGFDQNAVVVIDDNSKMRGNPITNETQISLRRNGYINEKEFSNYYNLMNTAVHERYHIENHLDVITTIGKGSIEHLKAYNAQIEHYTWKHTTEGHQNGISKNITYYISYIPQSDGGKLQNTIKSQFGKKLDIKINW
jgi:RHS repeat-associated protein